MAAAASGILKRVLIFFGAGNLRSSHSLLRNNTCDVLNFTSVTRCKHCNAQQKERASKHSIANQLELHDSHKVSDKRAHDTDITATSQCRRAYDKGRHLLLIATFHRSWRLQRHVFENLDEPRRRVCAKEGPHYEKQGALHPSTSIPINRWRAIQ